MPLVSECVRPFACESEFGGACAARRAAAASDDSA